MPRKALLRKACGERSEDFHTAEQWESNGIFRLRKSLTRLFRQPERTTLCGVALFWTLKEYYQTLSLLPFSPSHSGGKILCRSISAAAPGVIPRRPC